MVVYQGEKFKEYLNRNGISVVEASKILGVSRQNVYQYFKSNNLSPETVNNFIVKFKIDIEEMFPMAKANPRREANPIGLASDPNEEYPDRFTHLGDGTIAMKIPIIKQRAYAGYLRGFADPEYYEDLPTMTIDVLLEHKGVYLAFEVVGDSMTTLEPGKFRESIFDGTYVVGRELQQHHWKYKLHTHSFDNWIIVHKTEGILVKKISKHDVDNGIITISSLNPDKDSYPDQDLHLNDIQQIFNVVQTVNKL